MSSSQKVGLCGFKNIGNTCYMNSVLQLLINTNILVSFLFCKSNPFNENIPFVELVKNKQINARFVKYLHKGIILSLYNKEKNKKEINKETEEPMEPLSIIISKKKVMELIETSITVKLAEIINTIIYKGASCITPSEFKKILGNKLSQFRGFQQQDAHELLSNLIDIIIEETGIETGAEINNMTQELSEFDEYINMNRQRIENASTLEEKQMIVREVIRYKQEYIGVSITYGGYQYLIANFRKSYNPLIFKLLSFTVSTFECIECKFVSAKYEHHTTITLPIDSSVDECFNKFTQNEIIDKNCDNCNCKKSNMKTKLFASGTILYIQLCRFTNLPNGRTNKNNTNVNIPNTIDISRYSHNNNPNTIYKLKGIINHMGSLGGGHYTADCFSYISEKWINYNDNNVSEYEDFSTDALNSSPYILLYELDNKQKLVEG